MMVWMRHHITMRREAQAWVLGREVELPSNFVGNRENYYGEEEAAKIIVNLIVSSVIYHCY